MKTEHLAANEEKRETSGTNLPDIDRTSEVSAPTTRTQSAYTTAGPKAFMTHDYRLRRERTTISGLRRGKQPLRALKDPRYISLRKTLVPSESPVDGYLQLSPSGQYVLQKYGTPHVDEINIQKLIRGITMYGSLRRQSVDPVDLFHAHVGGMDTLAESLLRAAALIEEKSLQDFVDDRYSGWKSGLGLEIAEGNQSLESLHATVLAGGVEPEPRSGRQEMLENRVNNVLRR